MPLLLKNTLAICLSLPFFVSLSLGVSMLKFPLFASLPLYAFALSLCICSFGGLLPHIRQSEMCKMHAADTREQSAALSGFSRATRQSKLSIQRY